MAQSWETRRRRSRRQRTRTLLLGLAVVSVIALLLPRTWTSRLISLAQVLVPFQHATTATVDSVADSVQPDAPVVSGEQHAALQRQKAALENEIVALATRVQELEQEVDILTATRLWGSETGHIGARGQLIHAKVIAKDLLPWRSSNLINAGSLQGVRPGSPVTSDHFTIDRGADAGLRSGMSILLRETLVGMVEQVGTHTSRIKLLSDVDSALKVRIGQFTDDGFQLLDRYFWLVGRGKGVMEIQDAERREVDAGIINVGDIVLSDPMDEMLPSAMTIGKIASIRPDYDNPLLAVLTIASSVDEGRLRRVYVFDPGGERPVSAPDP